MTNDKAVTLRELYQLLEAENPAFLDCPLVISVKSATSVYKSEGVALFHDLWKLPRYLPNPQTGEQGRVMVEAHLTRHSLTSVRKA